MFVVLCSARPCSSCFLVCFCFRYLCCLVASGIMGSAAICSHRSNVMTRYARLSGAYVARGCGFPHTVMVLARSPGCVGKVVLLCGIARPTHPFQPSLLCARASTYVWDWDLQLTGIPLPYSTLLPDSTYTRIHTYHNNIRTHGANNIHPLAATLRHRT